MHIPWRADADKTGSKATLFLNVQCALEAYVDVCAFAAIQSLLAYTRQWRQLLYNKKCNALTIKGY
jgi:hypothetical protein